MRVTFHTDRIKSVLLFVHRLTATERASIETVITGQDLTVYLTLVRTTVEDLKRFMRSVPEGEAMAESVQEVTEQMGTGVGIDRMEQDEAKRLFDGATFTITDGAPQGGFSRIYEGDPLIAPLEWFELLKQEPKPVPDTWIHLKHDSGRHNALMYELENGPYAIICYNEQGEQVLVETGVMVNGRMVADKEPKQLPLPQMKVVKPERT